MIILQHWLDVTKPIKKQVKSKYSNVNSVFPLPLPIPLPQVRCN